MNNPGLVYIKASFFCRRDMVLSSDMYKGKKPSRDKVRHTVKYAWANSHPHEKENQGILGCRHGL
jgi:hypothetical protein